MALLVSALWLCVPLLALALLRVLGAPVLPELGVLTVCVALSPLAAASLWVPLSAGVAGVVVGSRWTDDGSRLGLLLVGLRGRDVLRALTPVFAGLWCVGLFGATVVEPGVVRWTQRTWTQGEPQLPLWSGARVQLGSVSLVVDDAEPGRVWAQAPSWVATSPEAAVDGGALRLADLELVAVAPTPMRLSAAVARVPLQRPVVRVPLAARGTLELVEVARRTAQAGGGAAYEWSVLYKRFWCGTSAVLWLGLGWVLGGVRRRWAGWGAAVVGWLVATRLGDVSAEVWGPALGSAAGPLLLVVALCVWSQRSRQP